MADKTLPSDPKPTEVGGNAAGGAGATNDTGGAAAPGVPRRGPGHRGADVRDTVAEMAAKAQEISQEAGSKIAAAMKDVISAAAGLTGFAVESARDLVQYMVRRGQMTPEEGDKLLREAEEAHVRRGGTRPAPAPRVEEPRRPATPSYVSAYSAPPVSAPPPTSAPAKKVAPSIRPVEKPAEKPPARSPAKPAAKAPAKAAPKKSAAAKKKPATKAAKKKK